MPNALKPFGQILEADSIWRGFRLCNRETGAIRDRTLYDHYSAIEAIQLSSAVPESIREQFDIGRNLLLHSWFVYNFIPVSQLHAISSVEHAIRIKSGRLLMLKPGLELAIKEKCINDSGFRYYTMEHDVPGVGTLPVTSADVEDVQAYCKILSDAFPYLRNELAHGNPMSYPGGLAELAICADLINQLFDGTPENR